MGGLWKMQGDWINLRSRVSARRWRLVRRVGELLAAGGLSTRTRETPVEGVTHQGHAMYDGHWISYRDFERILLSLGASGSDVQRLWPNYRPVPPSPHPDSLPLLTERTNADLFAVIFEALRFAPAQIVDGDDRRWVAADALDATHALARRVAALSEEVEELRAGVGVSDSPDGDLGSAPAERVTHGRHCPCSACAREDWSRITAPCGMHGADCPREYAPTAAEGRSPNPVESSVAGVGVARPAEPPPDLVSADKSARVVHNGVPDDFWRKMPCGHPPDPLAALTADGHWICHCGWVLDPEDAVSSGHAEGAPGRIVPCGRCGCYPALDESEAPASGASAPLAAQPKEPCESCGRLREQLDAARQALQGLVTAAHDYVQGCECSGSGIVTACPGSDTPGCCGACERETCECCLELLPAIFVARAALGVVDAPGNWTDEIVGSGHRPAAPDGEQEA
jgi:hypothetical protein